MRRCPEQNRGRRGPAVRPAGARRPSPPPASRSHRRARSAALPSPARPARAPPPRWPRWPRRSPAPRCRRRTRCRNVACGGRRWPAAAARCLSRAGTGGHHRRWRLARPSATPVARPRRESPDRGSPRRSARPGPTFRRTPWSRTAGVATPSWRLSLAFRSTAIAASHSASNVTLPSHRGADQLSPAQPTGWPGAPVSVLVLDLSSKTDPNPISEQEVDMSEEAFVYEAIRTPRGKQKNGALHEVQPLSLVVGLVDELRKRFPDLDENLISDMILGVVSPVGDQGGDIARAAVLAAGMPDTTGGVQLNRFCASGLEAVNI